MADKPRVKTEVREGGTVIIGVDKKPAAKPKPKEVSHAGQS